nr:hypothetical protein [Tanacetum cinerariifolium]
MTCLVDKAIFSGVDNHPPMLEKDMYDSWKSRMELYMLSKQHGRMILEYVENGPLLWPTVEENGMTRLKKYSELSTAEAIQADCDVKATNIILQGLPPEVYALVSTHKVAKELWERIQMLMQGTSLTKQERECKLYDEFDKFVYGKGESLRDCYLRFSLLLNDMNTSNMKLEQFQVNTKFLNTLPPEWSKFVTDVKFTCFGFTSSDEQVNLSTTSAVIPPTSISTISINIPVFFVWNTVSFFSVCITSSIINISFTNLSIDDFQSSVNHNVYNPSSSMPHMEYASAVHQQTEFTSPDTGLVVLVFQKGDDPIDAINQDVILDFGCYLTGRQNSMTAGSPRPYTSESSGTLGKQRVIVCYNCKGEGHMSKQCTKPKRKRDKVWFKEKVLLVQAQANGQVLEVVKRTRAHGVSEEMLLYGEGAGGMLG